MRRLSLLILCITLFSLQPTFARVGAEPARQDTALPNVFITAPTGGQALQGQVEVTGNSAVANFQSASLSFSYHDDPTGTWFLILESDAPVAYGTLGMWDTTTISDGDYDLRLSVALADDSLVNASVAGLRVRNYTAIETDTPTPPAPTATTLATTPVEANVTVEIPSATPSPTITATATQTPVLPTITPLPTNPAELSESAILSTLGKGGLAALGVFALLGIYLGGRAILRRPPKHPES